MNFFIVIILCFGYLQVIYSRNVNITEKFYDIKCDKAKTIYKDAGFNQEEDIYTIEQSETLKICRSTNTCCKVKAEYNLVTTSEEKRKLLTVPQIKKFKSVFHSNSGKFKAIFRKMLTASHASLDNMFRETYQTRYTGNAHVFKALYTSLNQYLNGSELLIKDKVDVFFAEVHKIIYTMTKPLAKFNKQYENCIYESTNAVQPFGDMQRKIGHQTSRSFYASRVFLQGLKEGMQVITDILNLPVHDECSIAFMKMTQCSICSGVSNDLKPCSKYCTNVMKGCFAYIIMIQPKWNEFINDMVALAEKLEGPFSMEAVVEPLGVKISEAVMTFQDNLGNITVKVEEKCGIPPTIDPINSRKRRSDDSTKSNKTSTNGDTLTRGGDDLLKKLTTSEDLFNTFKSDTSKIIKDIKAESSLAYLYSRRPTNASEFETLLRATKTDLNNLKDYWINLPNQLCNSTLATTANTTCWNGYNTSGYSKHVVGNSVHDLFNKNPEMKLNVGTPNNYILKQAKRLDEIISKIKVALIGDEPNDNTEGSGANGSGEEGSGEGSGDPVDPTGEGSGSGVEPVTTTKKSTVNPCINSVNENCLDEIETTNSPNDVNNLPIINDNVQGEKAAGINLYANILLLWLSCFLAYLL